MSPILFHFFGAPVYAYRTLLAVSFVVCTLLAVRESRRPGGVELSPSVGIWAMFGSLIGARAFFILQYGRIADLWRALILWEGGLVFYGGLLGGLAAVAIHLRLHKIPLLNAADSMAPYVALGEAITRIGCFCNGCCWGAVCHLPWAVTFPAHSPAFEQQVRDEMLATDAVHALPVHPTQLYMSAGLVVGCFALRALLVRRPPAGVVFFAYLLLYGFLRFIVELLRGDSARSVGGLTVSGGISLALAFAGAAAWVYAMRRSRSMSA